MLRTFAIIWVFLVHFVERFMEGPLFGNPSPHWPQLSERFAQVLPLDLPGFSEICINLLRYVGWLGDFGVQFFLAASGFSLTWRILNRSGAFSMKEFYFRRFERIMPSWWLLHLFFLFIWIILGIGLSPLDWRTWSSFAGVRFLPGVFYYFAPAWWFVGLILQLYLVFPFLLKILNRMPAVRFFIVIGGAAILIRTAGLFYFDRYLDAWSRGAFFLSRLPEFAFGMSFAKMLVSDPQRVMRHAGNVRGVLWGASAYILGTIASFTLLGMSVAFLLTGTGFFVLVFATVSKSQGSWQIWAAWPGRRAYVLFLIHHPVILFWVPASLSVEDPSGVFFYLFSAAAISVLGAMALKAAASRSVGQIRKWREKGNKGGSGMFKRIAAAALAAYGIALAGEAFLRSFDPQEVLGWGERASLEPHDTFGYRLKPNRVTRLRWEGYDYVVEANELGFPGPLYAEKKDEGTYRIFVTGDAFESAEGVDTDLSWPRLLEKGLTRKGWKVQVMNFSITGWGPNQYEAAVRSFAPKFLPDLIVIGFFVNEFFDVQMRNQDFEYSIGFTLPKQNGIESYLGVVHLKSLLYKKVLGRLRETKYGYPYPIGYFLGNFSAFERKNLDYLLKGVHLVEQRLGAIKKIADEIDARMIIVLVPASIQICGPESLSYYPKHIQLTDASRFDLDQPQRLTREIANRLKIDCIDLRSPLKADSTGKKCPYHPRNMHWTQEGHRIVSMYMINTIENYFAD